MRRADTHCGKGKSDGLRIIDYWQPISTQFWLFTLYNKNEAATLNTATCDASATDEKGNRSEASPMKKRDVFAEIAEGLDALRAHREGKTTLRTHAAHTPAPVQVTATEVRALRRRLNMSRAALAARLRTNPRTLENWEQGRAKPNAQAALLIRLASQYPEIMDRLAMV